MAPPDDPFAASVVPWFRDNNGPERELIERLERVRANNPMYPGDNIEWRPTQATDFRSVHLSASAERLIRWDIRTPHEVFRTGFVPKVCPNSNGELTDGQCNIATYVRSNANSIFVSTTRTHNLYTEDGEPAVWTADARLNRHFEGGVSFKYEIYAHGGIEVNPTLGTHRFEYQNEVAFAGGIRREFIRSAIEYHGNEIARVHINPYFDWNASGRGHSSRLPDLPEPTYRGVPVEVVQWEDGEDGEQESENKRERRSAEDDEDMLMREPGSLVADETVGKTPNPRSPRALLLNPASNDEVYVFAETKYVLMKFAPPGSIINGPKMVVTEWPSLRKAGFAGRVSAILPNPGNSYEAYFFCEDKYALISIKPGTNDDFIINGPKSIRDNWPSLRDAGFEGGIDAAIPNPSNSYEAYFFRGDQYVLIRIVPGTTNDTIINGPKPIHGNWPSLEATDFGGGVDAAIIDPSNKQQAYFFSRDRYALVDIKPGTTDDTLVSTSNAASKWSALRDALFY